MNQSFHLEKIENDYCGSNAYVAGVPGRRCALVIDPSDFHSGRIAEHLGRMGQRELLVLLSHEHFDHMSGVSRLRERFTTTVIALDACSRMISDPRKNLSRYSTGIDMHCDGADITWLDGDFQFSWNGIDITMLATPGHSPGSICISVGKWLFSGDTLMDSLPTVTKLPGGDRTALMRSVSTLLTRFPADTTVWPGHGSGFRLGELDPATVLTPAHERSA